MDRRRPRERLYDHEKLRVVDMLKPDIGKLLVHVLLGSYLAMLLNGND